MKFKKVEIQAFRAYNQLKNGTFDFEISKGGHADFISIYAPNGFGKTSFYDAVEYGMTNNINRFIRKASISKDWAKSDKQWSKKDRQYILRNRFSDPELDSFIRLTTTNQEQPLKREIPKPAKKGADYKFDPKLTESEYFQTVILSQEWISAFLKEDSGASRYNIFMENFGDKEIDGYYKNLVALIQLNEKRIKQQKDLLKGVQTTLNFSGDENILTRANLQVKLLQDKAEQIRTIGITDSETDDLNLINFISERIASLDAEKAKLSDLRNAIELIYTGDTERLGLEMYYQGIADHKKNLSEEQSLKDLLQAFKDQKVNQDQIAAIESEERQSVAHRNELSSLISEFQFFLGIAKNIEEQEVNLKETIISIITQQGKLIQLDQAKQIKIDQRTAIAKELSELELEVKNVPELEKTFLSLAKQKQEVEALKENLSREIQTCLKKRAVIIEKITNLVNSENSISSYDADFKDYPKYELLYVQLLANRESILEKQNKIENLSRQIAESQDLNKDLQQFIIAGSRIVSKQEESSCPLCRHKYKSFDELQMRITNNEALSHIVTVLIQQESDEQVLLSGLTQQRDLIIEKLLKLIADDLDRLRKDRNVLDQDINDLSKKLEQGNVSFDKFTAESTAISSNIANKTFPDHQKQLADKITRLNVELRKIADEASKLTAEFGDAQDTLKRSQKLELELNGLIDELKSRSLYIRTIKFFDVILPVQEITANPLEEQLTKISAEIDLIQRKKEEQISKKAELTTTIGGQNELDTELKLSLVDNLIKATAQLLLNYERTVAEILDTNIKGIPKYEVVENIEMQKLKYIEQIDSNTQLIQDYQLLSHLRENVQPFLKYQKAKKSESDIKNRIDFLEKKVAKELEVEKERVAQYIGAEIETFFYNELINDLYRRIDPHPDYQKIRFVCDFAEDKPKLDICVYDNKNEVIIPNLYFSTAQLNILSLSIFLAKALNAKDENGKALECIFIDDPIQSMDSINILSTIDLLRSIVVNQKKQIILSTHDDNFHQLLRKKMPPGKFKSKFIELETFGKVKKE